MNYIRDCGDYLIIACPKCGHLEAFVYKSAIQKALDGQKETVRFTCNRLEKCGAQGQIPLTDLEITQEKQQAPQNTTTKISETGRNKTDSLYRIRDFCLCNGKMSSEKTDQILELEQYNIPFKYCYKAIPNFSEIRGIALDTFVSNDCCFWKDCFPDLILGTKTNWETGKEESDLFREKLQKIGEGRNLIFPIFDEEGRVGRVLLRSTREQKIKEIQMKLRNNTPEIWNIHDVLDPQKKYIFICEGVFDALSIKEVAKKCPCVGAISIPGVRKIKKTLKYLKQIAPDKIYVLATDNDAAGKKYKLEGALYAREIGVKTRDFPIKDFKDVNEFLQGDRDSFEEYFNGKIFQYETGTELNLWI